MKQRPRQSLAVVHAGVAVMLCAANILPGSLAARAQGYQVPSSVDMQKMQAEAEVARACMAGIDREEIDALQREAQELDRELKALCNSGEREKAQVTALAYATQIRNNCTLQAMRECSEKMTGMMANMMPKFPSHEYYEELESRHICD